MDNLAQGHIRIETETPIPLADHQHLAARIKRSVRRHAGGGVRSLEVHVDHEAVRLHGACSSFYCKQLAQTAAMRLSGGVPVVNSIEVDLETETLE